MRAGIARGVTESELLQSWEIAGNLLIRHVRFSPRLGEKPSAINAAPWTHAPPQQQLYSITVRPSALAVLRLMANSNLVEARQAGQRPSPPNELRSWLISGLSYRTR